MFDKAIALYIATSRPRATMGGAIFSLRHNKIAISFARDFCGNSIISKCQEPATTLITLDRSAEMKVAAEAQSGPDQSKGPWAFRLCPT
jgi:hypothetical protein